MNDIAIDVKDVTIRFNLASEKIDNLKEYFVKLIKHELLFQEFLAVRDASFTIRKGEAWALVGSNGSGKSTLLKWNFETVQRRDRCKWNDFSTIGAWCRF